MTDHSMPCPAPDVTFPTDASGEPYTEAEAWAGDGVGSPEIDRLRAYLRHIIQERDDTFALMISRAETSEAQLALARECIANLEDEQARYEAQLASMTAERQKLAEAICGGEDFPGYLAAQPVEALIKVAKNNANQHSAVIDMLMKAEAERDALVGAVSTVLDKAIREYHDKEKATSGRESRDWQTMRLAALNITDAIRALTPADATTALDHMIAQAKAEGMREAAALLDLDEACVDEIVKVWARNRAQAVLAAAEKEAGRG